MSYACIADRDIAPPPIIPSQLQADLMAMSGRSKAVSNPATIQISAEANNVTIRGVATSKDEARTIESMIRMTPGVHGVKNELAYPTK
jgi:osmotically-inducible protein OsmY